MPSLGYAVQSGPEGPVPVASLTKMATAVVILRDHPLTPGSSGPLVPVDGDDAAQFGVDLANDETNIPLQPGEAITEANSSRRSWWPRPTTPPTRWPSGTPAARPRSSPR